MHIYTLPVGAGPAEPVTSGTSTDWSPVWAPDGKYLYFASDRGGSMNLWRVPIDEVSGRPSGEPEAVTTPAPFLAHPSLSGDGTRIAYSAVLETQNIQRLPFDPVAGRVTGEPEWLTTGSRRWSSPDVSQDGQRLAFQTRVQPEGRLYVMRTDRTGLTQLPGDDKIDRVPRWSPKGDWIAFFSNRSGGDHLQLWKIRPDGSGRQQLTDSESVGITTWSPDGTRIAVSAVAANKTYVFDPDRPWSGQTPHVLPPPGPSEPALIATSWSPDGEQLAFQTGFNEGGSNPRLGVVTYSLRTGAYQRLTDYGEWPVWLGDSRRILFVSRGRTFHLLDSRTRSATRIFSVEYDSIGPPRVPGDGRFIYFTRRVTEADIHLVTLR
jgi:Tol biopolymer transport system component